MTENYAIVSVAGGKFHRPHNTAFERGDDWKPRLMLCGRTLEPLNYFETEKAADSYTGGRLAQFACSYCAKKVRE